jgi:hypothetical protein
MLQANQQQTLAPLGLDLVTGPNIAMRAQGMQALMIMFLGPLFSNKHTSSATQTQP